MKPLSLLNERAIITFMKVATVEDVEAYFNSIILMRKHFDKDSQIEYEYIVKLTDSLPPNTYCYEVSSNAIGLEAIRNLTLKHRITDGGTESENSKYIGIYFK